MNDRRGHPGDRIQDLLDGRLDPSEEAEVGRHLETCAMCRRERDELARVKGALSGLSSEAVPEDLAASVTALLDRDDRPSEGGRPAGHHVRNGAVLAAAALAIIAVFLVPQIRSRNVVSAADRAYSEFREGRLRLDLVTDDPQALERFFVERGIAEARVFDLAMMGYRLSGGRIHRVRGRPSAFYVYAGEGNKILVCQMYEGSVRELPPGAERRNHSGISFFVYRRNARTLVFWQERGVVCALVSDAGEDEVVQLAFAKALKT